ncbi:Lrp/AsnC family transcriptional regulator [Leifsonia aquatica]|uniref:Lrp/AsnC family transcriptional regulator n=1 Tax=Leifsonia aquatica TaxID=144185 RepID=UPI0028A7C6C5|nr:Lrp/AsnC family transcriptional regulator [Leifsonia aquatica]
MRGTSLHGLKPAKLDAHDRQLVELLQEDGRSSISEMARTVGLSHAAVRARLNRLLDDQVVSIAAVTHPGTHGYAESATIAVRTDHRLREVSAAVAEIPEAYYVVAVLGEFDLLVEVMAVDGDHLQDLVLRIREIPGVLSTSTYQFVKTVKWVYSPEFVTPAPNGGRG